ncbi:peptidylprolyl isomerase [Petropleomorpha daqingensis]|uniref:Peptidyl-prolyl cis-trans isomerase SurA n=1 Tax=Petropleomorpha daqingensis TaxID=2026353 RepID=A0A853CEI9_9ACTN|nr:peptidyl-prolyl cis-trans isomerase SurA [Petropleomorpha daqingensis]
MRTRFVRRPVVAGFLLAVAVGGLTGCRTSPTVAAYVGEETVTVSELQSAEDSRRQDDAIDAYAKDNEEAFTRQVLSVLVGKEVYAAAAEHWHVSVSDAEVSDRIDTILDGADPSALYDQAASQGLGKADVFELVREQLLRQEIARAEGLDDPLSEAALQKQYQQNRDQYKQYVFGYIAVPDQATADGVLAALTADPSSYPAVAAGYDNGVTLLQPEARPADQLPQVLAQQIAATPPGSGFTVPVQDVGVVVAFVTDVTFQAYADVKADLQDAARSQVDDAATKAVSDFRDGLDVTINPRYGVLKENRVVADDSGVVQIVSDTSSAAAPSSSTGG